MKHVPLHVTAHRLNISPALQKFLERKIGALARFAGDMIGAEIILRGREGAAHRFSVTARLALPGRDVQGKATGSNLYRAINQVATRLARLTRKRKTRLARMFRREGRSQMRKGAGGSAIRFATAY